MDLLANAALLGVLAWGFVFLVLVVIASIFTGNDQDRIPAWVKVLVVFAAAYLIVFVVAASSWAESNSIAGVKLSDASFPDLLIMGLLTTMAEAAVFLGMEKVIPNIGIPMPSPAQRKALDQGAERYAAAQLPGGGGSHPGTPDPTPISTGAAPDLSAAPASIPPQG